jgi:hypothetical protein
MARSTHCHTLAKFRKRVDLKLQSIQFSDACSFIARHHRHHKPPTGHKFSISVRSDNEIVGVIIIGRPVARYLDDGNTLEVTRCCTNSVRNAASMLYSAAARAAKALGYHRLITYTLASENGASLRAAGWRRAYCSPGGTWSRPSRRRLDPNPTEPKWLWEAPI